jgi:hypothetical protein
MSKNLHSAHFRAKKSSTCPIRSAFAKGYGVINRDKIESICSPKMYKNNPDYIGARGQRDE